jgi:hypothetical protein
MEIHHDQRSVLENIAYGERERAPVIALAGGSFRPRELYIGYETSNFRKVTAFYAAATRLPVKPRRTPVSMVLPFDEIVAAGERGEAGRAHRRTGSFLDVFFRTLAARGARIHHRRW